LIVDNARHGIEQLVAKLLSLVVFFPLNPANPMKRFAAACFRALAEAFAGVTVMGLIMVIATHHFDFGAHWAPADLSRFIVRLISGTAALGAVVATLFGAVEIRGRTGSVIGGMVFGGVAGVLIGPALGAAVAPMLNAPVKAVAALGIFAGLGLGVIVGGIVGTVMPDKPKRESPARPKGGVGDRTLDA